MFNIKYMLKMVKLKLITTYWNLLEKHRKVWNVLNSKIYTNKISTNIKIKYLNIFKIVWTSKSFYCTCTCFYLTKLNFSAE